jgi:dihydroflavonol-4-reductase
VQPGCISGPSLGSAGLVNPINDIFRQLLDGEQAAIIKFGMPYVDVRDVALAHVLAVENDKARGRYLCAGESIWSAEMSQILKQKFPKSKIPSMNATGAIMTTIMRIVLRLSSDPQMNYVSYQLGDSAKFDNSKIENEFGLQFRDVRPGWFEVIEQMAAAGIIKSVQPTDF